MLASGVERSSLGQLVCSFGDEPDKGNRKWEPPATDKTTKHIVEVTHTILTSLQVHWTISGILVTVRLSSRYNDNGSRQ
jgi:hypothetical protein